MEYVEVRVAQLHSGAWVPIYGFSPWWSRKQNRRARELAETLRVAGVPAIVVRPGQRIPEVSDVD